MPGLHLPGFQPITIPAALIDDGSCEIEVTETCYGDLNGDGVVSTLDLLDFLSVYGSACED